ncbi:MAG: rod shape-determining protein RodA [Chloroflexi bacterium]|nr:MAG: rod shape-determining protein RodA [Chloroflexota bacterium]
MDSGKWRHFDFWLLGAVALLTIFGITMIGSTIRGNIDLVGYDRRQLIFAVAGFVAMIAIAYVDYHLWSAINRPLYFITAGFLAVLLTTTAIFGSARWFSLAIISIQPSEFAKIVVILILAEFFARNRERIGDLRVVFNSFLMMGGLVIWIILQPNLSTSIVIIVIWFALLWVSGLRIKHLLLFAVSGAAAAVAAFPFLEQYQQDRILNFIFEDPDARHGNTYNVIQALISIGSGGWFGQGYGQGSQVQLRFLKVRWSDFIFSAMANEFGFVGVVIVILILLFVIYRCLRAARLARDTFGGLICYGVATLLAFQTVVNIGVNLKLLPATGLPLPFLSYGGSSLFSLLICIGLVQSVILRHKSLEF